MMYLEFARRLPYTGGELIYVSVITRFLGAHIINTFSLMICFRLVIDFGRTRSTPSTSFSYTRPVQMPCSLPTRFSWPLVPTRPTVTMMLRDCCVFWRSPLLLLSAFFYMSRTRKADSSTRPQPLRRYCCSWLLSALVPIICTITEAIISTGWKQRQTCRGRCLSVIGSLPSSLCCSVSMAGRTLRW